MRLVNDISVHFRQRLLAQIEDVIDTARRGGLPASLRITIVHNNLIRTAAVVAQSFGITREHFKEIAGSLYDEVERVPKGNDNADSKDRARGQGVSRQGA